MHILHTLAYMHAKTSAMHHPAPGADLGILAYMHAGSAAPVAAEAPPGRPSPVPESPFARKDAQGGGALAETLPNGSEAQPLEAHGVSPSGAGNGAHGTAGKGADGGAERKGADGTAGKGDPGSVGVEGHPGYPAMPHTVDGHYSRTSASPHPRSWAAR